MNKLDERLYTLRREHKLTQEDVASTLGVTRQTISNWENGSAQPTIDKAIILARIYGISLDILVGNSNSGSKQVSAILKSYQGSKGTLFMNQNENQPFFPEYNVKNVEILEVGATAIKVRIHDKEVIEQLIFTKDILGFMKVVT